MCTQGIWTENRNALGEMLDPDDPITGVASQLLREYAEKRTGCPPSERLVTEVQEDIHFDYSRGPDDAPLFRSPPTQIFHLT